MFMTSAGRTTVGNDELAGTVALCFHPRRARSCTATGRQSGWLCDNDLVRLRARQPQPFALDDFGRTMQRTTVVASAYVPRVANECVLVAQDATGPDLVVLRCKDHTK